MCDNSLLLIYIKYLMSHSRKLQNKYVNDLIIIINNYYMHIDNALKQ